LLQDEPAVASQLERTLFEQGFQVLHLDDQESPFYALPDAIRAAHAIGAVLIYSGPVLDVATKQRLASQIELRLLELSRESRSDEELLRRALSLADSLRIAKPQENQEKAN
jgi:hypothetical protein